MTCNITFNMDNASFADDRIDETVRVVHDVAETMSDGSMAGIIRDTNGNIIGKFVIYKDTGKKGVHT